MASFESSDSFEDIVVMDCAKSADEDKTDEAIPMEIAPHEVASLGDDSFEDMIIEKPVEEQHQVSEKDVCKPRTVSGSCELGESFCNISPISSFNEMVSVPPYDSADHLNENTESNIRQSETISQDQCMTEEGSFNETVWNPANGYGFNITQEEILQYDHHISSFDEDVLPIRNKTSVAHLLESQPYNVIQVSSCSGAGNEEILDVFTPNVSVMESEEVTEEIDIERLRAHLTSVHTNRTFDEQCVNDVVSIIIRNRNTACLLLCDGLCCIMTATHDIEYSTLLPLFQFVSKVILYSHSSETDKPLSSVCEVIELAKHSSGEKTRSRCCFLLQCILYADAELREQQELEVVDDGITVQDQGLPFNLLKQWGLILAQRRRDKAVAVRAAAIRAISQLPLREEPYTDDDNKEFFPNDLVFDSLHDSAVEVRQAAVQSLVLRTFDDVGSCIAFIEEEEDSDVRKLLVEHLIRSTHIRSFTTDARIRLLRLMLNDENSVIRLMVPQLLVPKWLENCHEGIDNLEDLLQYIDPLYDEDVTKKVVTFAISHHMELVVQVKDDGEGYLKYLLTMPAQCRDELAILHAHSLPGELKRLSGKNIYLRLFFHRCLTEHLCSLYGKPEQFAILDKVQHKLLPTLYDLAEMTGNFALDSLKNDEELALNEFSIRQLCYMLRIIDKTCNVGRESLRRMLYQIAGHPEIRPSPALVDFAMREVLLQLDHPNGCYEDTLAWARDAAAHFLRGEVTKESSQNEDGGEILSSLLRIRIIGLASCLDEHIMTDHLSVLRHVLESDVCEVKDSALSALADIVCVYGFKEIAKLMFGTEHHPNGSQDERNPPAKEEYSNLLAKLFEETLDKVVFTCLRILYATSVNWPAMLGRLLLRIVESESLELEKVVFAFLDSFTKQRKIGSVQLVMAYLWCVAKVQEEESANKTTLIRNLYSYVRGFLRKISDSRRKRCRSKTRKEECSEKERTTEIFPSMLLCRGILNSMLSDLWGPSARSLAQILTSTYIQDVDTPSLLALHSHVIEKEGLVRLANPIRRFTGSLENLMRRRNCKFDQKIFEKKLKREISEDWDPNWSVKFSPKTPKTPKRVRSIKREPNSQLQTPNQTDSLTVPSESSVQMIASVKKSLSQLQHEIERPDCVIVIESDEGDSDSVRLQESPKRLQSTPSTKNTLPVQKSRSINRSSSTNTPGQRRITEKTPKRRVKQANVVVVELND
ncbi:hypothetical protein RB195_004324 [Necator americanus]|uniref:Nuclear condensin complex subunit 3 C-terminal domain-containing protein n=1 Tax=Necator americanus TaxID=51031 RepID=A0ABR1BHL9_NECAM